MTEHDRRFQTADAHSNPITGKILFQAELENISPLLIGNGPGDLADVEILRDASDGKPFIPATSLAGVIRRQLEENDLLQPKEVDFFFGCAGRLGAPDNMRASQILFENAVVNDVYHIRIRDSVRIHSVTATAADTGKFDYEILEPGSRFAFCWEITLRRNTPQDAAARLLHHVHQLFEQQACRLGAKTNAGFGRLKLVQPRYLMLDFAGNPADVKTWLLQSFMQADFNGWRTDFERLGDEQTPGLPTHGRFFFEGLFKISDSLMVKDYASESEAFDIDAVMVMSRTAGRTELQPVLPGPSIRGALRHQAARIFNTFYPDAHHQAAFRNFFGHVDTAGNTSVVPSGEDKSAKAVKSRLRVEEHLIQNPLLKLQQRIKIDRFTGGTVPTALFDCAALWHHQAESMVHVELEARIKHDWEAGLLLLVIKDLWLGWAAVGGETGVGRGRLAGYKGTLRYNGVDIALTSSSESPMQLEITQGEGTPDTLLNRWIAGFREMA